MMKKILFVVLVFFASTFTAGAQKQEGYVRTLEKAKRPSQGIEGVSVNILEYPNTLVTKKGGKFSFTLQGKKQGDAFKISRIQKKGYTLVDKHITGRKHSYSATVPIEIVMVSDKQLAADKKMIEDKAYAKAKNTYEKRVADLERQLAEKTIDEQAYYAECERLSDDYDSYTQLISDMAERYAMTDYKGLSDLNRQILECIENAELERADSLINSKGDFDQREQELRAQMEFNQATADLLAQSQQDAEFKLNDLAQDYYNKFIIHWINHQHDSAYFYLMRCTDLDPTNIEWQNVTGAIINRCLHDYTLAMKYLSRGLNSAQNQFGENSEQVATFYSEIGNVYQNQAKYETALEYYEKALAIREKVLGADNPSTAYSYSNIGDIYLDQGNLTKALEYFEKSLAICERALGTDNTTVAAYYNQIGLVYFGQGEYTQALEYLKKSLAIREREYDTAPFLAAGSYSNLARVYQETGDTAQAMELFKKSLSILEQYLGPNHPSVASLHNNIGTVYNTQGNYTEALEHFHKALAIRERISGCEHPSVATYYGNIASAYYLMEDYDKSLDFFTKAYDLYLKLYGSEHKYSKTAKSLIDHIKGKLGK